MRWKTGMICTVQHRQRFGPQQTPIHLQFDQRSILRQRVDQNCNGAFLFPTIVVAAAAVVVVVVVHQQFQISQIQVQQRLVASQCTEHTRD